MDAVFVNEPGIERSQVQDEAFLKLFKDKRQREMRFIQSYCRRKCGFRDTLLHIRISDPAPVT